MADQKISELIAGNPAQSTDKLVVDRAGADRYVTAASIAALGGFQPLDSDLTAIAALATTSFGRSLLTLADAAALITAAGAQPLDSDLTAIAALATTSFGRSVLALADAAALRSLAGTVVGTDVQAYDADLAAIAALTTTSFGRSVLTQADASALRTLAGLIIGTNVQAYSAALATYAGISPAANVQSLLSAADYAAIRTLLGLVVGTNVQAQDSELSALAGLTSAANKLPYFTGAGTAAVTDLSVFIRTLLDDADATAARATLGITAPLLNRFLSADVTNATGTKQLIADATNGDWRIAMTAGRSYRISIKFSYQNNNTGGGIAFSYTKNSPIVGVTSGLALINSGSNTLAATYSINDAADGNSLGSGAVSAASTTYSATLEMTVVCTTSGNFDLCFARSIAGTATVKAGSHLLVWEI